MQQPMGGYQMPNQGFQQQGFQQMGGYQMPNQGYQQPQNGGYQQPQQPIQQPQPAPATQQPAQAADGDLPF